MIWFDNSLWSSSRINRPKEGDPPRNNADWNRDEDADLIKGFLRGDSIEALARRHGRKINSIQTRLETGRATVATSCPAKPLPKEAKIPHVCHFTIMAHSTTWEGGKRFTLWNVYECDCGKTWSTKNK